MLQVGLLKEQTANFGLGLRGRVWQGQRVFLWPFFSFTVSVSNAHRLFNPHTVVK